MPRSRTRKPYKKPPQRAKVIQMTAERKELGELPDLFPTTASLAKIIENNQDDPKLLGMLFDMLQFYRNEYMRNLKKGSAAEVIEAFYHEADQMGLRLLSKEPDITCRKGCAHCCHITVTTTEPEVDLILEYTKKHNISIDIEWLKQQRGFTEETHMFSPFSKCVFLNEQNECTIYPVRPMSCRKYFVSSDPELCNAKLYSKGTMSCVADFGLEILGTALMNVDNQVGTLNDILYNKLNKDIDNDSNIPQ
jgi:Fe-S-cluster containining protein